MARLYGMHIMYTHRYGMLMALTRNRIGIHIIATYVYVPKMSAFSRCSCCSETLFFLNAQKQLRLQDERKFREMATYVIFGHKTCLHARWRTVSSVICCSFPGKKSGLNEYYTSTAWLKTGNWWLFCHCAHPLSRRSRLVPRELKATDKCCTFSTVLVVESLFLPSPLCKWNMLSLHSLFWL